MSHQDVLVFLHLHSHRDGSWLFQGRKQTSSDVFLPTLLFFFYTVKAKWFPLTEKRDQWPLYSTITLHSRVSSPLKKDGLLSVSGHRPSQIGSARLGLGLWLGLGLGSTCKRRWIIPPHLLFYFQRSHISTLKIRFSLAALRVIRPV